MPTMTVPSAAMRRLKMAAAAARSAATNDPTLHRSADDGDARGRGRAHRAAARQQVSSSSSGKRGATRTSSAAAEVNASTLRRSAGDGGCGREHRPAAQQQVSTSSGKRGATSWTGATAEDVQAPPTPPRRSAAAEVSAAAVTAPSGRVRVFELSAVVVSAAGHDGCVEVVYDGRFPPEDPSASVRVAMDRIVVDKAPPLVTAAAASACSASAAAKASRRSKKKALAVAARKWIFSW